MKHFLKVYSVAVEVLVSMGLLHIKLELMLYSCYKTHPPLLVALCSLELHPSFHQRLQGQVPVVSEWTSGPYWMWGGILLHPPQPKGTCVCVWVCVCVDVGRDSPTPASTQGYVCVCVCVVCECVDVGRDSPTPVSTQGYVCVCVWV